MSILEAHHYPRLRFDAALIDLGDRISRTSLQASHKLEAALLAHESVFIDHIAYLGRKVEESQFLAADRQVMNAGPLFRIMFTIVRH